jgi:hypothetical protein
MTRLRLCSAILCLVPAALLWEPPLGWAWGGEAHAIIALLADQLLQTGDPLVEKKLTEILAADKSNTWTTTDIAGPMRCAKRARKDERRRRSGIT